MYIVITDGDRVRCTSTGWGVLRCVEVSNTITTTTATAAATSTNKTQPIPNLDRCVIHTAAADRDGEVLTMMFSIKVSHEYARSRCTSAPGTTLPLLIPSLSSSADTRAGFDKRLSSTASGPFSPHTHTMPWATCCVRSRAARCSSCHEQTTKKAHATRIHVIPTQASCSPRSSLSFLVHGKNHPSFHHITTIVTPTRQKKRHRTWVG